MTSPVYTREELQFEFTVYVRGRGVVWRRAVGYTEEITELRRMRDLTARVGALVEKRITEDVPWAEIEREIETVE